MSGVYRLGQYYANVMITGPQHLLLQLEFVEEQITVPCVTALKVCKIYGCPTDDAVRTAVLMGTDQANAEFGTKLHPLEIRFSYSGYDVNRCELISRAAYHIVQAIAEGTVKDAQAP